jgi:hypothetical protein
MRRLWSTLPAHLVAVLVYFLAALFTSAYFMADTADYLDSILAYVDGRYYDFWEFGHVFWRPLGTLVFVISDPLAVRLGGDDARANATYLLLAVNWVSGLISVCALRGFIGRVIKPPWVSISVTSVFVFSHAFLNFSQTGCSYIPGLALVLVSLYLLARCSEEPGRHLPAAFAAGVSLAGAVCLWFPYILVLPATAAMPIVLGKFDRKRCELTCVVTAVAVGFVLLAYGLVIWVLGINSPAEFMHWMSAASHGNDLKGVTRMFFGFARSFVYMGNDGILFKRYLVGDKFNPVTLADLFRVSLWRIALFYTFLGAICFNLVRLARTRRIFYLLVAGTLPVILFAIFFDGGAVERYLPLYPFVFLALAGCVANWKSHLTATSLAAAFCFVVVVVNASAMANVVLDRQQEETAARISDLQSRLKPQSRIVTVNWQDQLVNFHRSFPLHSLNRSGNITMGALVTPGTDSVAKWREDFATYALTTWDQGGDLWISRRVLSSQPKPEWNWVEGDDRRVSWTDFYQFFSAIELEQQNNAPDGFALVLPSTANKKVFAELLQNKQRA